MMCEECHALLDTPPQLLEPPEAALLRAHLDHCLPCRREAERLEALLARFKALPLPVPRLEVLDRLNARIDADVADEADAGGGGRTATGRLATDPMEAGRGTAEPVSEPVQASAPAAPPPRSVPRSFPTPIRMWAIGAAAAAGLLLVLLPRADVRFKGGAPDIPLALDLQVSVEHADGAGHPRLVRAEDGMTLAPDDGLLFHFGAQGGSQLTLLEQDPQHHLKVVYERGDLARLPGPASIDITNPAGRPLSYVPDGPPGEYTWLAVLARQAHPVTPALLDAWWGRYVDRLLDRATPGLEEDIVIEAVRLRVSPTRTTPASPEDIGAEIRP